MVNKVGSSACYINIIISHLHNFGKCIQGQLTNYLQNHIWLKIVKKKKADAPSWSTDLRFSVLIVSHNQIYHHSVAPHTGRALALEEGIVDGG